jgi:hypothetical protein
MGEPEDLAVWYLDSGDEHRADLPWGTVTISQSEVDA